MMVRVLRRRGHEVNRKRVQPLMLLMGIRSLAPQSLTTKSHPVHPKYPYLLRNLSVDRPNQVWCADIIYIPFKKRFSLLSGNHGRSLTQSVVMASFQHHDH
jgi:putative transposase